MWSQHQLKERRLDVFTPESPHTPGAVIYLHGHAGESLVNNDSFTREFEKHGLRVVAPHCGPCWWLDVPSPAFDSSQTPVRYLLDEVVPWIAQRWDVHPPQIALLGVSMGGQGALNLSYRNALRFPIVAALSPAIDFDQIYGRGFGIEDLFPDPESARQETAVLHLHPLNWPKAQFFASDPQDTFWHAGSERLASKLMSSGVPFQSDLQTSHGGHGWNYFNAMAGRAVEHIASALQNLSAPS